MSTPEPVKNFPQVDDPVNVENFPHLNTPLLPVNLPEVDDTPKFVDKRRRGIDRAFFKPLPPTRPTQGNLPGIRKP